MASRLVWPVRTPRFFCRIAAYLFGFSFCCILCYTSLYPHFVSMVYKGEVEVLGVHHGNETILKKVPNRNTYLFSAIIPLEQSVFSNPVIVLNAFDDYKHHICCVIIEKRHLFVSTSSVLRQFLCDTFWATTFSYSSCGGSSPYPARQLTCPVQHPLDREIHVSLTTNECSKDINQYQPVLNVKKHEGKLGICAKIAYNDALKPTRLIEWMEFQKMMGVDRVVVYILDVSDDVLDVFDLYSDFVTAVPYQLPGDIVRSMRDGNRSFPQFSHDEQLSVYDCRDRLSGFSHVAVIDFDEIILPRSNVTLKTFLQTTLSENYPDAGAYYFYQQFHITDWVQSNPENTLITMKYQETVPPRWESQKFIYIPERTEYAQTHQVKVKSQYETYKIDPEVAVIHHYRACPASWTNCHTRERITDRDTMRYQDALKDRIEVIIRKLNRKPFTKKDRTYNQMIEKTQNPYT